MGYYRGDPDDRIEIPKRPAGTPTKGGIFYELVEIQNKLLNDEPVHSQLFVLIDKYKKELKEIEDK